MNTRSIALGLAIAASVVTADVLAIWGIIGRTPIADAGAGTALLLLSALPGAVIVAFATAPISRERGLAWLTDRRLPTDDASVHHATSWLRRTRALRGIGFAVPFVSGTGAPWLVNVAGLAVDDPVRERLIELVSTWPLDNWIAPIAGYALGAIVAELTRPALDDASIRTADLRPRSLPDYLKGFSRQGPRVLGAVAVVVALVSGVAGVATPYAPGSVMLVIATLLAVGTSEAVSRGVVRRRQPAANATAIALDDGARSTTVHAVAGSAIGIIGAMLGQHIADIAFSLDGGPATFVSSLGLVAAVGAYGVWLGHGVGLTHRIWRGAAAERDGVPA